MSVSLCCRIYRMVTSGECRWQYKVKDPLDHWEFCESLSFGLLHYDPSNRRFPSDELFRISRQQNKRKIKRAINYSRDWALDDGTNMSLQKMNHDTVGKINVPPRLYGSLESIKKHHYVEVKSKHPHMCVAFREPTYSKCSVYNASLHYLPWKGSNEKNNFFQLPWWRLFRFV